MTSRTVGEGWQCICLDCGASRLVTNPPDPFRWTCPDCIRRREEDDKARITPDGERVCRNCSKRLARLNMGPFCYACEQMIPHNYFKHPCKPHPHNKLSEATELMVIEERRNGKSQGTIAAEFNISLSTVHAVLVRRDAIDIPRAKRRKTGVPRQEPGRNKLTTEDAVRAVARYRACQSAETVGREFGVSADTVLRAFHRSERGDDSIGPAEAARMLGVQRSTIHRWVREGLLPVVDGPHRQRRLSLAVIKQFAKEHK